MILKQIKYGKSNFHPLGEIKEGLKKHFYILTLIFALPLVGLAQNNKTDFADYDEVTYRNQIDLDVEFLAFSFGYNHRIYKNWFLGVNVGLGVGVRIGSLPEIGHFSIVTQYKLKEQLKFEFSPTVSGFHNLDIESPESDVLVGISIGAFYGNKVQVGYKLMLGLGSGNTFGFKPDHLIVTSSLVVLKISIKRY